MNYNMFKKKIKRNLTDQNILLNWVIPYFLNRKEKAIIESRGDLCSLKMVFLLNCLQLNLDVKS